MAEHALKEWAVTIQALARGAQVLIVRKGGIGEKRFELPHPRFFLLPTHLHQRPELVKPEHRDDAGPLSVHAEPARLPLRAYAEVHAAHPITDPKALAAIDPLHILTADYAAERLRWRRTQPLWAVVLRVWRVEPAPTLELTPDHMGCVSWVTLPEEIRPEGLVRALDDGAFAAAAGSVEAALAAVKTA